MNIQKVVAIAIGGLFALVAHVPSLQAQDQSLAEVKKRGVLRVAGPTFIPYIQRRPSGEYVGVDVDILKGFVATQGLKIEFIDAGWDTTIAGLQTGKWDVVPVTCITPARQESVDFTIPYFASGPAVVFAKGNSKITSLADLDKPEISFAQSIGTWAEPYVKQRFPKAEVKGFTGTGQEQLLAEILSGRADAMVVDGPVSPARIDNAHPGKFAFLPGKNEVLPGRPCSGALVVAKGAASLKAALDQHLEGLKASGELGRIHEQQMPGLKPSM
jgi:polar amino acid transport system substrate-binding protein